MVDVLYQADESFLIKHDLIKGSMRLVDAVQAEQIYSDMTSTAEMSGGSVGNSMAAIASFGGKCSYIGKISDCLLYTSPSPRDQRGSGMAGWG